MRRCLRRISKPWAVLVIAVAVQPRTAAAESTSGRKAALTTSLVTPFFGAYLLEGTLRVSTPLGLLANCSYLSIDNPNDDAWHAYAGTVGAGLDYYVPLGLPRHVYLEAVGEAVFASWHHQPSGRVAPIVVGYTAIGIAGYRYIGEADPCSTWVQERSRSISLARASTSPTAAPQRR